MLEVALGVVVVGAVLWPVTAHPVDQLAGTLDAPYHGWLGWRISELWRQGQFLTVVIPDAVAPIGLDLRLVDGLLPAWVTAMFNLFTGGNLILSYNLALATGIGVDLWAGRRLAQVLSNRRWVWFACGVAFATAPALAGSAQAHIAFVFAFTLPLLLREAIVVARGDVGVRFGRIAALAVIAYLCSAYHLIFGAIMFAVVLACWPRSTVWARTTRRGAGLRLALAALITLVVLSPFIASRMSYERDERAAGSPDVVRVTESLAFSADALGVITPPDSLWLGAAMPRADLGPQLYAPLRPAFAGYAFLAGIVLLAFSRVPARRPLLIGAVVLWVLSLGPALHVAGKVVGGTAGDPAQWLPYRFLQAMPGLGALRAPTRAGYALAAVLAAALAAALDATLDRLDARRGDATPERRDATPERRDATPERRDAVDETPDQPESRQPESRRLEARFPIRVAPAVVAVIVVALVVMSITAPMPASDLGLSSATRRSFERIAAESPEMPGRDGILIVPWACRLDAPRILAMQSIHRQPYVGCNPPPTATRYFSGIEAWASSVELAGLRCDQGRIDRRPVPYDGSARLTRQGIDRLRRDLGVRYVIVDTGLLAPGAYENAKGAGLSNGANAGDRAPCAALPAAFALLHEYEQSSDGVWVIVDLARPKAPPPR